MAAPADGSRASPPVAVVFDMDGLLLDSERVASAAFEVACAELDIVLDPAVYARCIGSSWEATRQVLSAALGDVTRYETLRQAWDADYRRRIDAGEIAVKPGARDLLDALEAARIPRALATSTRRPTAMLKLSRSGLLEAFACLVCGGETERGKPHPEPYLAAVAVLGAAPARCWALEDSENGVRAAHAAGLRVIQVPDLIPPSADLQTLGHTIAGDLFEVLALLRATNC